VSLKHVSNVCYYLDMHSRRTEVLFGHVCQYKFVHVIWAHKWRDSSINSVKSDV